jgi:hypothetical protein
VTKLVVEVSQGKQLMLLDHFTDTDSSTTMASNSFFAPAPTVVLPPNQPDQHFPGNHYADSTMTGQTTNGISTTFTPIDTNMQHVPPPLAGRKRSRGDVHAPEEEEVELGDGSVDTPLSEEPVKPRGKPVFGPGMTLIYPEDPGYTAAAESQSGTWVEERTERKKSLLSHGKRPSISTRKSQRLGDDASSPDDLAQLVLPPQMREVTSEPLIDEATRSLGISWTRMDSSEALQISRAAYSKWIQNHYPSLNDVSVWFEYSAIPAYLVEAQNTYNNQREYYLFSNDLTEARLVTSDPSQLVPRLQMLPALELAAPGGHIRAETDTTPATPATQPVPEIPTTHSMGHNRNISVNNEDYFWHPSMLQALCSAHEMEMD